MSTSSFNGSDIPKGTKLSANDTYFPGSFINARYRVESRLPNGKMGRVYKCLDIAVYREVVVKSVDADLYLRPKKQNELIRKIQNWEKLPRCSNLVNITEIFYANMEKTLFFVMPHIHGHREYGLELKEWIGKYRFSEAEILYLGIAVCNTMKECLIKTGNIPVHGDINPSNIYLEYVGERFENQPFLSCNIRLAHSSVIGRTSSFFPKEYNERNRAPDWASDVYALITVLHEMEKYTLKDYDVKNSAVYAIYNLLILQKQWKKYNLVEVLDVFLLPLLQVRFGINPEELLHTNIQTRAVDIFNLVKDIHSKLQMPHKDDSLLDKIGTLWKEAESRQYEIYDIPLTCFIDRHYFVCARLCEKYELAENILCRYEKALYALSVDQKKRFGYDYSEDLGDDFKILHAQYYGRIGRKNIAIALFHEVKLRKCICYNWLEQYVDICAREAIEGQPDEGRYLQEKLKNCINAYGEEKGIRALCELRMHLGILTMHLGETSESVAILEKCVQEYPDDLDFLYHYGYALIVDGQISKAKYPLKLLYDHCQAVRDGNKTEDKCLPYPAQKIALYSRMAAYMIADFSAALEEVDALNKQYLYYQGHIYEDTPSIKQIIQESYDTYYQFCKEIKQMSVEAILQNFTNYLLKWKDYVSSPLRGMSYLYKRGELQVMMDLYMLFADIMLANKDYDELIFAGKHMLSIVKDNGTVKLYLARAYAMKGEAEIAAGFYAESADMLKYEYPQLKRDGTEMEYAQKKRAQMREEMKRLGLDVVIY